MRRIGNRRLARNASGSPFASARAGLSIIEVLVTLSILVVAGSLFCQMLVTGRQIRMVNHEKTLAADAARVVLERMRNIPFLEVYRAYNEDPKDDPGGIGTAPGPTFEVDGLEPGSGATAVGRILFPSKQVVVSGGTGGSGGGKVGMIGGGGVSVGGTYYHLHEDVVDVRLGMPRDLNGDNKVDALDHSSEYLILPVCVRVEWKGTVGQRSFEIVTQLADFPLKPEPPAVIEETPVLEEPVFEDPVLEDPGFGDPVVEDPFSEEPSGPTLEGGL
jgi:hypothetical protein